MGQLPKSKIEQLKKEKREAKAAKKRKVATRDKWYLLHFAYLDAGISRADYISKLEAEIRRFDGFKNFKYRKNDKGFYSLLQKIGNVDLAKARAQKLRGFFEHTLDYKSHKPCTTVDILVEELEHPENLL